ncbi:UNVERIFIED_CONTAM: hypothetical protein PYX00_007060 [Menopon gallinae]|uniref:Uncharacterized protein n=1 Tax=Menopon gallinae TaxID=328185 RepID=A0AAW2HI13_9NEOP
MAGPQTVHTQPAMWRKLVVFAVVACRLASGAGPEKSVFGQIAGDKQVYLSEKSRFIKFDAKDDEVEIELGISVPVVKIPLQPKSGREESGISVSAPGLVVAGVLALTMFLVIPFLFTPQVYKDFRSDNPDMWNAFERMRNTVYRNPCIENALCRTAKTLHAAKNGTLEKSINNILMGKWMTNLLKGTFIGEAIMAGMNNSECPGHCPNTRKHPQLHNGLRTG